MLLPIGGCHGLQNCCKVGNYWNEKMLRDKHAWAAKRAWNDRFTCFENQPHVRDFANGFKAGYIDVADGGTGCVPTFPPRDYWGWKFQSCEGQARVSAWFAGYPHGARAAEEEGIGNYYQIQTSMNIQQQYAQHGRLDPAYQGIYPVPQQAVPSHHGAMAQPVTIPGEISLQSESPSDGIKSTPEVIKSTSDAKKN
jgi:hypothetical protein